MKRKTTPENVRAFEAVQSIQQRVKKLLRERPNGVGLGAERRVLMSSVQVDEQIESDPQVWALNQRLTRSLKRKMIQEDGDLVEDEENSFYTTKDDSKTQTAGAKNSDATSQIRSKVVKKRKQTHDIRQPSP
jgi:hypothetical protein